MTNPETTPTLIHCHLCKWLAHYFVAGVLTISAALSSNGVAQPLVTAGQKQQSRHSRGNEASVRIPPQAKPKTTRQDDVNPNAPWLRTAEPMTLLSVNDGQAHLKFRPDASNLMARDPLTFERTNFTRNSITGVRFGSDHPPLVKTVYGTVPNTVIGPAYLATSRDGRYAYVTCHTQGNIAPAIGDILSVVDLDSPDLEVVQKLLVPSPMQAVTHPDGRHMILSCAGGFQVYKINDGRLTPMMTNAVHGYPITFDIAPSGERLVAALWKAFGNPESTGVHVFSYSKGVIEHQCEVRVKEGLPVFDMPFGLRFSPDGKRVLCLNGLGLGSKGNLDDVLSIDMSLELPIVNEVVQQVGDGLESVAFHPSGKFAVVSCLDEEPMLAQNAFSHLAILDLRSKPLKLLYSLPVEPYPEGIAFTRDGKMLFVQLTSAHHIAVFDVDGLLLKRSPFVIRVGHGPSSMALVPRNHVARTPASER